MGDRGDPPQQDSRLTILGSRLNASRSVGWRANKSYFLVEGCDAHQKRSRHPDDTRVSQRMVTRSQTLIIHWSCLQERGRGACWVLAFLRKRWLCSSHITAVSHSLRSESTSSITDKVSSLISWLDLCLWGDPAGAAMVLIKAAGAWVEVEVIVLFGVYMWCSFVLSVVLSWQSSKPSMCSYQGPWTANASQVYSERMYLQKLLIQTKMMIILSIW